MLTKPCARLGCSDLVVEPHGPVAFARRQYCSTRCGMLARRQAGWRPVIAHEKCRAAGKVGGTASGRIRRERALRAAVAYVVDLIPPALAEEWSAQQHALLLVLMGRAARRGYRLGKAADTMARKARRLARQAEKLRQQAA